ncbi:MAG TPA: ABC transporter ATP-binding protein [Solirubrobacteraceae bacterium]|nr:ABC transporter ATP-binding protein [Solirubrobacteraceae bacterium]
MDAAGSGPGEGAEVIVEHVTKRFGERVTALRDVSLEVPSGQFVLLTGPSGSGKSTLLNLIAGFDRPDAGRVLVGGRAVSELDDPARFRRETIGFVFQLHHLISGLTAEENVEVPLIPVVSRRSVRLERARAALHDVNLDERCTHLPAQLSGGERQRVALARALVGSPRLLLADEPTGALDSAASAEVLGLLAALSRRSGTTVLLVSHELDAARHVDRVVTMRDGTIVDDHSAAAIPVPAPGPAA